MSTEKIFKISIFKQKPVILIALSVLCFLGLYVRFYGITANNFFHYDEGLYLNHNRALLEFVQKNYPHSVSDWIRVIVLWIKSSLYMTKALWVLLIDIRMFWHGVHQWWFARLLSALFGVATIGLVFQCAKKYFNSAIVGFLSALFLTFLPSHVYYSRMALQEACCTFFFLGGMYFYLISRRLDKRAVFSFLCFGGAFFTNYRLIIIPLVIFLLEGYLSFTGKRKFDIRKYVWHTLGFFTVVFLVGALDKGQNTYVIFAWIFHQVHLAKGVFVPANIFSYPYYIFRLEGVVFGLLFFGNVYYLVRRRWDRVLPFGLVLFFMGIYTTASDQGLRYLCVMYPFVAMAMAVFCFDLAQTLQSKKAKNVFVLFVAFGLGWAMVQSLRVAHFHSDYATSVAYMNEKNPGAKILSSQPLIQNLFTDTDNVKELPRDYPQLLEAYAQGYRFLVIDPQAYISWTKDKKRFLLPLVDYLDFIQNNISPDKIFEHFNGLAFERFVFEHNDNLPRVIHFLNNSPDTRRHLYVYRIDSIIGEINRRLAIAGFLPRP